MDPADDPLTSDPQRPQQPPTRQPEPGQHDDLNPPAGRGRRWPGDGSAGGAGGVAASGRERGAGEMIAGGPRRRGPGGAAENPSDPLAQLFVAERPAATIEATGRTPAAVTEPSAQRLGRRALVAFVLAFAAARILAVLVLTGRFPDVFAAFGGTAAHHLNFGVVLLGAVAAFLLFARPRARLLLHVAAAYGAAMGLAVDELGMWVHAAGGYWPRLCFDAVVMIVAVIGLIATAPWARFRQVHWITTAVLVAVVLALAWLLVDSLRLARPGATVDEPVGPTVLEPQAFDEPAPADTALP